MPGPGAAGRIKQLEDLFDRRSKQSDRRLIENIELRTIVKTMFPVMESGMCRAINGSWDGRQWAVRTFTPEQFDLLEKVLADD